MTIIDPNAGAAGEPTPGSTTGPIAAYAPNAIALESTTLRPGRGRGRHSTPTPRFALIDSTLMIAAVQTVVLAGLVPLPQPWKFLVLFASVAFLLASGAVAALRFVASRRLHAQRRVVVAWLVANSSLTPAGASRLAWSEPAEIGDGQYEFRASVAGRMRSLIIDLDIRVASLTTE